MRVLSVIDSLARGGAERSLVELAPHLRTAGVDLRFALLEDRPGFTDELRDQGFPVTVLGPGGRVSRARQIARVIDSDRIDLCHTTLYESDIAGRLAAFSRRVPTVTTLANVRYGPEQYAEPGLSSTKLRAAQALDIVTARTVRRFHAVSVPVADAMAPRLRVARDRIEVIPRGRDRTRLGRPSPERRQASRAALGIDEGPVVLAVARHEHQKGLDVLLDATATLVARWPDVVVLVAGGEGRQTDVLRRRIAALGLADHVSLLGPRDDVGDLLCAADVFTLPSRREGFPGALLEAMALDTPVVVSDIPMAHEAVPDDRHALFVPVDDDRALAEALARTLDDPEAARQRAAAALARFEERFTIERVARAMADLFGAVAPVEPR